MRVGGLWGKTAGGDGRGPPRTPAPSRLQGRLQSECPPCVSILVCSQQTGTLSGRGLRVSTFLMRFLPGVRWGPGPVGDAALQLGG